MSRDMISMEDLLYKMVWTVTREIRGDGGDELVYKRRDVAYAYVDTIAKKITELMEEQYDHDRANDTRA